MGYSLTGAWNKPPKRGAAREKYLQQKEIKKQIDEANESNFSVVAAAHGGHLAVVRSAASSSTVSSKPTGFVAVHTQIEYFCSPQQ